MSARSYSARLAKIPANILPSGCDDCLLDEERCCFVLDAHAEKEMLDLFSNRAWRLDSSPADSYEATRGHWKVAWDTRSRAKYAVGVAFGIVRGAYEIESWFESTLPGDEGRWGFIGRPAPELDHIVGTNIRAINIDGSQNPYRKFLTGFKGAAIESME